MRFLTSLAAATICGAVSAHADPLTCDLFKQRLREVIDREGNKIAQVEFSKSAQDGIGGDKRYSWDSIVNLSGELTCDKDGHFSDFSVELDIGDKFNATDFGRLAVVSASSVCALTSSNSDACFSFVQNMFGISTSEFQKEAQRGEKSPGGTSDFFLFPKVDAEFDVTPASMNWSVGPGTFGPMDSKQVPLSPQRRDAD